MEYFGGRLWVLAGNDRGTVNCSTWNNWKKQEIRCFLAFWTGRDTVRTVAFTVRTVGVTVNFSP
jgi:hypothetical protein